MSLLPNSTITQSFYPEGAAEPLNVEFTLDGVPFRILNAGPMFKHTEAASITIMTADQAETDRLTHALRDRGGEELACGWVKDRFGLSWQIVPTRLMELVTKSSPATSRAVLDAMMSMKKIDIAVLEAAAVSAGTAA